jgi:hypothetical protein
MIVALKNVGVHAASVRRLWYRVIVRLGALAAAKKLNVVLAGRNKNALAELGDRLSLPTRVVGLNNAKQLC